MYIIDIIESQKIIKYTHEGTIALEEIGEVWNKFLSMDEFVKLGYNILSDYSNATFGFEINQTERAWNFFNSIKHIVNGKKEAVITNDPYSTAISFMFEQRMLDEIGFDVKVFSTEEAALFWLNKQ